MTDLPIWAQDRARRWIDERGGLVVLDDYCIGSLAALLVEVATASTLVAIDVERARVLAEVRRVVAWEGVEEDSGRTCCRQRECGCAQRILARLEKL